MELSSVKLDAKPVHATPTLSSSENSSSGHSSFHSSELMSLTASLEVAQSGPPMNLSTPLSQTQKQANLPAWIWIVACSLSVFVGAATALGLLLGPRAAWQSLFESESASPEISATSSQADPASEIPEVQVSALASTNNANAESSETTQGEGQASNDRTSSTDLHKRPQRVRSTSTSQAPRSRSAAAAKSGAQPSRADSVVNPSVTNNQQNVTSTTKTDSLPTTNAQEENIESSKDKSVEPVLDEWKDPYQ